MANVRCPMCSKVNKPDVEVCSFCGARLKPVRPTEPPPPSSSSGDEAPDWLRQLGSEDSEPAGSGGGELPVNSDDFVSANADSDMPDWLSRIREREQQEDDSPLSAASQDDEAPLDWLSSLQDTESDADRPLSSDDNFGDDWMARLSADQAEPSSSSGGDLPSEGESETSDWLSKLSAWGDADEQTPSDEPLPAGAHDEPDAGAFPSFSIFDTPEELPGQPGAGAFDSRLEEQPPQDDLQGFDWLQSLEAGAASQQETPQQMEGEEVPGWLSGAGAESPPQAGDLPDWLSGSSDEPVEEARASDTPDWLSADFGDFSTPTEATAAQPQEGDLPNWLAGLDQTFPPGQEQAAASSETAGAESGEPSWLREDDVLFAGLSFESPASAGPSERETGGVDDTDDWFSSLSALSGEEQAEVPLSSTEDDQAGVPAASPGDGQPEWLAAFAADVEDTRTSDVEQPSELPVSESSSAPGTGPFIDEETPDWLQDFQSQGPAVGESVSPLIGMDEASLLKIDNQDDTFSTEVPDWLGEEADPLQAEVGGELPEAQGEELAQAELPEWVKDMRPIESLLGGESGQPEGEQRVENAGPLAGLRGVLPADEMVTRYRKLPAYSIKLRASEKQRGQAALFDTILGQESTSQELPPVRSGAPGLILRILIAVVLLGILLLPRLVQMDPLGIPALMPVELQNMYEQIDQAAQSDAAPVLLAVDFEPGLSGEMRLAAAPVVEHLMARNARIVLISTVTGGPALGQALLDQAASSQPGYNLADQSLNLGFLPGGTISLLEFANQPRLAAPVHLNGTAAWNSPVLGEVTTIRDFAQVIVLTDSAETGRAWVEQIQPQMGSVPLLVVSSAQAAPLLMPYVESGQVQGMVSGLMGGVMYAQQAGQANGLLNSHWASYQVGVLLAFVLVLLGGLFSGVRSLFGRDEKEEA